MGIVDDEMDGMGRGHRVSPLVRFSAIGEAWAILMRRWPMWILTVLIVMVCYCGRERCGLLLLRRPARRVSAAVLDRTLGAGQLLPFVLSSVVISPFLGGMYRMACRQLRGQAVGVETLFSVVDVLPQLILGSVLYGLATFLGFCAFVLPMFVVSGVLMFTIPLIVDGGLDAIDALSQSWRA